MRIGNVFGFVSKIVEESELRYNTEGKSLLSLALLLLKSNLSQDFVIVTIPTFVVADLLPHDLGY